MQLKQFFDQAHSEFSFLEKESVIIFSVPQDTIPIIFTAHLITFLKDRNVAIEMFNVDDCELSHIFSQLETSFLGMKISYWLRGVENLDKKKRLQLLAYVSHYQGPHQIFFLGGSQDVNGYLEKRIRIELPTTITAELARSLLVAFKKNSPIMAKHLSSLVAKYEAVSLDQFCMLMGYLQVVGKLDDYNKIVERVIESEYSLFTLAQHFFAKNSTEFYKLWTHVQEVYPITFWCVYWSEQLWRAYHVHYFLTKGQLTQAKTASARLPFSFIQKDWKKVSLNELKNAHQWIYELDRAFKNSIETESGIDLFYNKFFLNEFDNKLK